MIRGIGVLRTLTYSQTLNVQRIPTFTKLGKGGDQTELGPEVGLIGKGSRRCGMNRLRICGVKTFGLLLDT